MSSDVFNVQVVEREGKYFASLKDMDCDEQEGKTWTEAMLALAGHLECTAELMAVKAEEILKAVHVR